MKKILLVSAFASGLAACSSSNPNSLTFVRNAETVERVFRAFEAEDGDAFWAEFAETAVWRGTGVNAPTTLSREKMQGVYNAFWEEFDYEIVGDLNFQPGVNPETQLPNGSVNGTFLWEVSRVASESSERRSVQLWIYESFDFNEEGQIVFTQVFSDLASAYRQLRETPAEE
ncbi:MAG: nuclear transport factor 2 family protein [Flavobacteriales bacterium]